MSKRFKSTRIIVTAANDGVAGTKDNPSGKSPTITEHGKGTTFKASDFSREDFVAFVNDGTLVEVLDGDTDAAAQYYDSLKAPIEETEDEKRERLFNEAKLLGVNTTKNMKTETLEARIAEAQAEADKRGDGTTPSVQEGAGRTDGNAGGDGDGAGGEAEGSAEGGTPPTGTGTGADADDDAALVG